MWLTSTRLVVLGLVILPAVGWAQPAPIAPAAPPAVPVVIVAPPAAPPVVVAPAPVAAPPVVVAPGVEPSECVTTTTVRCTGAAAPYAVQPAPTVVVPAQVAPPAPPMPVQPHLLLANPGAVGPGWHLVQSPDGQFWHERTVKGSSPGLWGTGLALWITSYVGGVVAGGMEFGSIDMIFNWIPIAGAFINAGIDGGETGKILWVVDGLVQMGGMVAFIAGLAVGPEKIERLPVIIAPTAMAGGGGGVAIQGRF